MEYHGQEKVLNFLRCPDHLSERKGGMKSSDWRNWNWPLPGKTTHRKKCSGYTTDDGIHGYLLESFFQLASAPDSLLTSLHEDNFIKVIPVFIAKDDIQTKPGIAFDEKQKQLVGSKIKIESKYISDNPDPDKQVLKNNMVHECEVLCITSADNKLSIPYVVNHLTKAISGQETAKKMSDQAIQTYVCLHHLKNRLINIDNWVIKDTRKCSSSCQGCTEGDSMCDSCVEKGVFSKHPV